MVLITENQKENERRTKVFSLFYRRGSYHVCSASVGSRLSALQFANGVVVALLSSSFGLAWAVFCTIRFGNEIDRRRTKNDQTCIIEKARVETLVFKFEH